MCGFIKSYFKSPVTLVSDEVFRDYLFELIILAEEATPDQSELKALAEKAADLHDVPEIDINVSVSFRNTAKIYARILILHSDNIVSVVRKVDLLTVHRSVCDEIDSKIQMSHSVTTLKPSALP